MRALSIAATGMQAQQTNVDVISHNIANMNTTGYKRQRAEFQDMLYQNMERPGATSSASGAILPLGIQIGVGVRTDAVGRLTEQGGISNTGNGYDLAISGRGYLQVTLPSGQTAYTRAGNLAINADGEMVTADGYPLEPSITIPQDATALQITRDGIVEVVMAGQTDPQQIGQMEIATFINPGAWKRSATICFWKRRPPARPTPPRPARPASAR